MRGNENRDDVAVFLQYQKPRSAPSVTYLELGLGMAGAFFPFSPFPSYCFPKAVVFDMLRIDDILYLFDDRGLAITGLVVVVNNALNAMMLMRGEASDVGAKTRARCI